MWAQNAKRKDKAVDLVDSGNFILTITGIRIGFDPPDIERSYSLGFHPRMNFAVCRYEVAATRQYRLRARRLLLAVIVPRCPTCVFSSLLAKIRRVIDSNDRVMDSTSISGATRSRRPVVPRLFSEGGALHRESRPDDHRDDLPCPSLQ
jgi:hypothetical protein